MNLSDEKKLRILLILGGFVTLIIIFLLIFGFDEDTDEEKEKIGFIITGNVTEKGWNESHFSGITKACKDMNLKLLYRENIPENSGKCPQAVEELISEGAKIIFLMSFNYPKEVRHLMDKHSNISFISLSTLEKSKNLTSCFARMYQGRYMSGMLAGMKTKTNKIGFVAAMSNSEVNRGINAFALGVQRANKDAKVYVAWTGDWKNEEVEAQNAELLIKNYGTDVLTYHQNEDTVGRVAEKYGVDFIGFNALLENYSEHYLASVICRWDLFYKDILQKYLKGELISIRDHWIGVQQEAIILSNYSTSVNQIIRLNLNAVKNELADNKNLIFWNEIYDNEGNLRCGKNQVISDYALLKNIDWLVRGVEVVK